MLSDEVLNIFKLMLISTFKPRRVMKYEFRVAPENEGTVDVMNTTLDEIRKST